MGLTNIPRRVAKLEYTAVRLPFTLLERHVVARCLNDEASLRLGFERLLGSLDRFAGQILADHALSRRGQALRRRSQFRATAAQLDTKAQAEEELQAGQAQARQAREQGHEKMDGNITGAYPQGHEVTRQVRRDAERRAKSEPAQADHAAETRAIKERDMPAKPIAKASTVDVTFTLPAEVQADSVALCGDFNQWSAESIRLDRDSDGPWRATVALEPGHRYRYRYLLDGERWENAWQADGYVPNSYGSDDSVVLVEYPHQA